MLSKLLKYDLKPIYKIALAFGLPIILCALLLNLTSYDYVKVHNDDGHIIDLVPAAPPVVQFLHTLFYDFTGILGIALILFMVLNTWKNFRHSFYSDTAYLTHTLPVSRQTLWTSKFLSAIIASGIIVIILAVACCILQATPGGRGVASCFGWAYDAPSAYYPMLMLNTFVALSFVTTGGLTSIILGYSMRKHHTGFSIIWGIVLLLSALIIIEFISELCSVDQISLINFLGITNHVSNFSNISYVINSIFGWIIIYCAALAIFYYIGNQRLKRGINLE